MSLQFIHNANFQEAFTKIYFEKYPYRTKKEMKMNKHHPKVYKPDILNTEKDAVEDFEILT